MNNEKNTSSSKNERSHNAEHLKDIGAERHKELAAERERNAAETSQERSADTARHEALEQARSVERPEKRLQSPAERRDTIMKRNPKASYEATMHEVRSQMSGPGRAFSHIIHNPTVEKVSDFVGGTVARPNAILSGAVFAFLFTLAIYLIARFNGYALSGTESIASFALGWLTGVTFDYLKLLITGKS